MPDVWVIGGANGAGKSTFARYVLPTELSFLNADEITKTLPDDFVGNREIESGRQLLRRMDAYGAESRSFAIETTLASRSLAPRLRDLRAAGYTVILHYIWVPSPLVAVERVAARVRSGGHDIPESTIHRRYFAGLHNFFHAYAPIADRWRIYENPDLDAPCLVVSRRTDGNVTFHDADVWQRIVSDVETFRWKPSAIHASREEIALSPLAECRVPSGCEGFQRNVSTSADLWDDDREVTRRFRLGVREVLRDHALRGNPVAVWRDGKVVLLSPEETLAELRPKRRKPSSRPSAGTASETTV